MIHTECTGCPAEGNAICANWRTAPDDDAGHSSYCARCGHIAQCHDRVTEKQLQYLVDKINELTDSPLHPWVWRPEPDRKVWRPEPDGNFQAQIGNYHLSATVVGHRYGGVCLHRMMNESGGVTTPLVAGYVPKRELYNAMRAFIAGLEYRKVQS